MFRAILMAVFLGFAASALAQDGAAVFKAKCASCHGAEGKSDTPISKAMNVPVLAGNANVQKASVDELAVKIKSDPKHPAPVKGLPEADLKAAAGFAKQLAGGQ